jgi:capsular polysaccharide export protein
MLRSRALRPHYAVPAPGQRFVYYPLHVPWDVQLTFRSPAHFDQMRLISELAAALPPDWRVVTKEHPAAIGSYPVPALRQLITSGRVIVAPPLHSSLDLARQAVAVVTVNSKVGFEAFCAGLPVVSLGPSFYRGQSCTVDCATPVEAAAACLRGVPAPPPEAVNTLLGRVWSASYPMEFYVQRHEALAASAAGMAEAAQRLLPAVA